MTKSHNMYPGGSRRDNGEGKGDDVDEAGANGQMDMFGRRGAGGT